MGCWAGEEHELPPPDVFNPTGYWEHRDVWALDEEILETLGATWLEPARVDLSRLPDRDRFVERARAIAAKLDARGAWMIKDPRLSIVMPVWREALGDPECVLVSREPLAVARSLAQRDGLPIVLGIALWEEYVRAMLASTIGLRRVVVAYEDLVATPREVASRLARELNLRMPNDDVVDPALNRNAAEDDRLFNAAQRELRDALRSGAALEWTSVPPIHPETRQALAAYLDEKRHVAALAKGVADRDALLDAIFGSRSWRLGFGLRRLLRRLKRSRAETAVERWAELRK
jgi:hypothetical protein